MISNFVSLFKDCHKPLDLYLNLKIAMGKSIPSRNSLCQNTVPEAGCTAPKLFNFQLRDSH
jgi:hypothetical protein